MMFMNTQENLFKLLCICLNLNTGYSMAMSMSRSSSSSSGAKAVVGAAKAQFITNKMCPFGKSTECI